jgi:glycosyltransferase involved in cell wall biosynthesis
VKAAESDAFGPRVRVAMLGAYPPAVGGIASCIAALTRSGLSRRHEFLPFNTYSRKGGSAAYGRETVAEKSFRVLRDVLRFPFFLARRAPQMVHVHTSFGDWSFWRDSVYVLLSRAAGKPVFLQIHGGDLETFMNRHPATGSIPRRLLSMPTRIGVLSELQERPLRRLGRRDDIDRVPNLIDAGPAPDRRRSRKRLGFPDRTVIVLFAAPHLYAAKGVTELIRAASQILSRCGGRDVRFCIIGGGGIENELRSFCAGMKRGDRFIFTGPLPPAEVRAWMAAADIFVLPSHGEGFPMSILEAMSSGLPVVASAVGAVPEMIDDGIDGILVPPRDVGALRAALDRLIRNPSIRRRMGERSREKAVRRYNLDRAEAVFGACYRAAAGFSR